MINGIGFEFPRDASDQWDGFNDAGMEHFAGSPYLALGREIPQNVVDATDVPPAKIVVRLIQIDTQSRLLQNLWYARESSEITQPQVVSESCRWGLQRVCRVQTIAIAVWE